MNTTFRRTAVAEILRDHFWACWWLLVFAIASIPTSITVRHYDKKDPTHDA